MKDNQGNANALEASGEILTTNGGDGKQAPKKEKKAMAREKSRLIFYILVMALPVLQFCICYIYVNFNSILMSFMEYNRATDSVVFAGFKNFAAAIKIFFNGWDMIEYSLLIFGINTLIVLCLAVVFSYYIYKKYFLSKLFRVVMYLPQMISGLVLIMMYKAIVIDVSTELFGVDLYAEQQLACILFFNIWVGFGTNVMLFTGSMSGIPETIVEAAHIDGATIVQEFFHITIPYIWKTFVTFIVVGIAGIFTNQMALYTFERYNGSEFATFGYYFYLNTQRLASFNWKYASNTTSELTLPILSAAGVLVTVVLVPITFGIKYLLEKFGPSME